MSREQLVVVFAVAALVGVLLVAASGGFQGATGAGDALVDDAVAAARAELRERPARPPPTSTGLADPATTDAPTARYRQAASTRHSGFDESGLGVLLPGDLSIIEVPQLEQALVWRVDHRERHANGDVSLIGAFMDVPGSVVVTLGRRQSFATLDVAGEVFNLMAINGRAWIADARDLGGPGIGDSLAVPVAAQPPRQLDK